MSVREINLLQSGDVSGLHLFDEEFLRNLWRRSYFYFNLLCVGENIWICWTVHKVSWHCQLQQVGLCCTYICDAPLELLFSLLCLPVVLSTDVIG